MNAREEFRLSRLDFINSEITLATPNFVIYEIAIAHGINMEPEQTNEELIHLIHETAIKTVKEPLTRESWRYIARYVNPNTNWKEGKLKEAFNFLWQLQSLDLTQLDPNFVPGLQTPDNPYTLNATVLYAFCRKEQITTWPSMSYEELAFAVRSLLVPPFYLLSHFITQLETCQHKQLVNTCLAYYHETQETPQLTFPQEATNESLENVCESMTILPYLQDRIYPRNIPEVVALIAHRYHLDISTSLYPFDEFVSLRDHGIANYRPIDPIMSRYYQVNPNLYSLDHTFNPFFSENYYSGSMLDNLLEESGTRRENRINYYAQLYEGYLTNSFYPGIRPGIKNLKSPFYKDDLGEVASNSIVCYGTPVEGFVFFIYSELSDLFRVNKAFLHPLEKKKHLTVQEITRLRFLVSDGEDTPDRKKLFQTMAYVDAFNLEIEDGLQEFITAYQETTFEIQEQVRDTLWKLFYIAMYMRAWLGPESEEEYPISSAPHGTTVDVYITVTGVLRDWDEHLSIMGPDWTTRINLLPLVKYEGGFVVSDDDGIGKTIGDKISIVKKGDKHNNVMGSCIRASSGWLAASTHRYMTIIGIDAPFDITKLAYIS